MEWTERWHQLTDREKEQFTRIVGLLLGQTFILREKVEPKEKSVEINRDFRFLENFQDIFKGYLKMSGWEFDLDSTYGVCSIQHKLGNNRHSLNKLATYILYVLRLIYEEEREKLNLRKDVLTTLALVNEKLFSFNLVDRKIADQQWVDVLSTLKSFQIIERLDGIQVEPESRIIIYPTILFVITPEKIVDLGKRLQESNTQDAAAATEMEKGEAV
ncbi:DUF4194 domain-containing protein [Candidatus Pristimantibacillus sp. PTI5]|uniref:DUF4194 domain-containing protein n=1 Tax=Candidatus Pristimantibacillus sp. PTI5 TaxID=3400422 RepID=UPI003B027BDC